MGLVDYNTLNVMNKALDATWLKQQVISQNIANDSTPDYKAKTVCFEAVLNKSVKNGSSKYNYITKIIPQKGTEQTLDGNNVCMEKEQSDLADAQLQYDTLLNKVKMEFNMIKSALQK